MSVFAIKPPAKIKMSSFLGCPGGVPNQTGRHEHVTLWRLGKSAFCEKSDEKVLVFIGSGVLWSAGALVEGFREDKSSRLGEDVC